MCVCVCVCVCVCARGARACARAPAYLPACAHVSIAWCSEVLYEFHQSPDFKYVVGMLILIFFFAHWANDQRKHTRQVLARAGRRHAAA